jgi:uncharacterized membrane protein
LLIIIIAVASANNLPLIMLSLVKQQLQQHINLQTNSKSSTAAKSTAISILPSKANSSAGSNKNKKRQNKASVKSAKKRFKHANLLEKTRADLALADKKHKKLIEKNYKILTHTSTKKEETARYIAKVSKTQSNRDVYSLNDD